jgi:AcrR family transcriptional regulator
MGAIQKRAYNSIARKERARLSRAKILESAKILFANKGYESTTIDQIAQNSGVSDPTIYALFKSKLGVLRAIMDECFPKSEHDSLVERAGQEKCPKKRLSVAAKLARQIYDAEISQSSLLQSACVLSPQFKQLELEREERRYSRLSSVVDIMYAEQIIDDRLNRTKALDIFWAFTGRDMYRLLVIERGWSSNNYETWLAETLSQILLKKD